MRNLNQEQLKKKINESLKKYFDRKIKEAKDISANNYDIVNSLSEYTLRGGKRIRPILFIYSYEAISGNTDIEIINNSIFLELLQSSLLIHDDIMDRDDLRRGKITFHKKYENYTGNKDSHLGNSLAIVAGDLALNYSYQILNSIKVKNTNKERAISMYADFVSKVDYGQIEDVLSAKDKGINKDRIEMVNYYKTATYTAILPILMGALLAGANKIQKALLNIYAKNIGIAFQLIDDIIGIFGTQTEIGKNVASDIRENKKTLIRFFTYQVSDKKQKNRLDNLFGKSDLTDREIEEVRKLYFDSGALTKCLKKTKSLINEAIKSVDKMDIAEQSKERFIKMAKYIYNKTKVGYAYAKK